MNMKLLAGSLAVMASFMAAGTARADVLNMPAGQKSLTRMPVGDAGNAADSTGYGAVNYNYAIGKYNITVAQYAEFLNAVAMTWDPKYLYSPSMATSGACGIAQSGSYGNYTYTVTGSPDLPVNYVTWASAARFCNWLQNGQPTGVTEGIGTTETGAYTMGTAFTNQELVTITRNPDAVWCIPTANEWYKAAYYNSASGNYYAYPTCSNTAPLNTLSAITPSSANYWNHVYTVPGTYLTDVGAFEASPGPYGTFDQGGDVKEWTEEVISSISRGTRGGSWASEYMHLQSSYPDFGQGANNATSDTGFRIVQLIPEPASLATLALGGLALLTRRCRR